MNRISPQWFENRSRLLRLGPAKVVWGHMKNAVDRNCRLVACWLVVVCAFAAVLAGQNEGNYEPVRPHSTAIDQASSRAEMEAEQLVALSADRIILILRDEPGLLLQVKKLLVRKAYEQ